MMLEITEREAELLRQLVSQFVGETKAEIHHTDTASFKDSLKDQQEDANRLLRKLTKP
jgi:hypothetical protein